MHSCSGLRLEFPEVQGVPNVRGDQVIWCPWFVLKPGAVPGSIRIIPGKLSVSKNYLFNLAELILFSVVGLEMF